MKNTGEGISKIGIKLNHSESAILADVSFCWYGLYIENVKIVSGENGKRFLSYPSKMNGVDRVFSCRPGSAAAKEIDEAVFEAYNTEQTRLLKKFGKE